MAFSPSTDVSRLLHPSRWSSRANPPCPALSLVAAARASASRSSRGDGVRSRPRHVDLCH